MNGTSLQWGCRVYQNFARQPGNNVLDTATFVICAYQRAKVVVSAISFPHNGEVTRWGAMSFTQTGKSLSPSTPSDAR